jgi:hypothetical protein
MELTGLVEASSFSKGSSPDGEGKFFLYWILSYALTTQRNEQVNPKKIEHYIIKK